MRVAGRALRDNITRLGPKVLPLLEQARFAANFCMRRLLKTDVGPYLPDFNRAFDHICLHTGAVVFCLLAPARYVALGIH